MFISTVIPTIGRETLARAVNSVLEQELDHAECEVIVVNDSGKELPIEDWQRSPKVTILSTNRRNRSIARNTGAAVANGRYLHFLDDDDYMLPSAFGSFWEAANVSSAAWLHGAFRLVDNSGITIVDVFPEEANNCFINLLSWEWLPLQASIIETNSFFMVGGFAMLESLMGGFEDIDLSRQIARYYDFINIRNLVACIRAGDLDSTTNYKDIFIQNRISREKVLSVNGSFDRLLSSAQNNKTRNAYWHGKIAYYYLISAVQNFIKIRIFTALSRCVFFFVSIVLSGKFFYTSLFWQSMLKPHIPRVRYLVEASGKNIFTSTEWNRS
jgi:glycosyltransferase involved in cell wall biosynthesis